MNGCEEATSVGGVFMIPVEIRLFLGARERVE
jgi:hypothetical protein